MEVEVEVAVAVEAAVPPLAGVAVAAAAVVVQVEAVPSGRALQQWQHLHNQHLFSCCQISLPPTRNTKTVQYPGNHHQLKQSGIPSLSGYQAFHPLGQLARMAKAIFSNP